jgi:opacity protein-like surface antigen
MFFSLVLFVPQQSYGQLYIGPYVGAAIPHTADASVANLFIQEKFAETLKKGANVSSLSISASDAEYDPGITWGGRVGYWMEGLGLPFLGLEAEFYGAFPKISDQTLRMGATFTSGTGTSVNLNVPIEEAELDIYTVGFNLLARYPFGRLQPYGGAGLGIVRGEITKLEAVAGSSALLNGSTVSLSKPGEEDIILADVKDTSPALHLIGGVKTFIERNTALFLEYKYVSTEFNFQGLELEYESSQIYGGIEFYSGPGFLE